MIPKRVCERMTTAMKRLAPIIEQQRARDVSEADTVTLVKDIMADVFGYDKYIDLTSEHSIRGTYCDLAAKVDDKCVLLIEVKAIGGELKDSHVKQAIDYGANEGIEWVILTNAIDWRLYHVIFAKPIDKQLVAELNLLTMDCRREADQDRLFLLTKEGFRKGAHLELKDRQDATSRFLISALLVENDAVIGAIRRELKRVVDVNVSDDDILKVLKDEVIKRDALEGAPAEEAARRINRAEAKKLKEKAVTDTPQVEVSTNVDQQPAPATEVSNA